MRTMTVSLSPKQAQRVEQAVTSGDYASASDVLRDALDLWNRKQDARQAEIVRLKRACDEGMASGPGRGCGDPVGGFPSRRVDGWLTYG